MLSIADDFGNSPSGFLGTPPTKTRVAHAPMEPRDVNFACKRRNNRVSVTLWPMECSLWRLPGGGSSAEGVGKKTVPEEETGSARNGMAL